MTGQGPICVTLAVASFRRPRGLERLLCGMAALSPVLGWRLDVVVVDNSPDGGAMAAVAARADGFPVPLSAVHEPRQGLSRARNAALAHALATGADYLAFIDDDEVPEPGWLAGHARALAATGAAASLGAVHASFELPPPGWVRAGRFLELRDHRHHGPMPFGATSNIVFHLGPVRGAALRFDPRFDLTGGEDTAFFAAYTAAGGAIVFAADAIVHETIPPQRATLGWLWRRWRRTGQTSARIRLARHPSRPFCAVVGLARIAAGGIWAAAALPFAPFGRPALWARGVRAMARGAGFVDAAAGHLTREYAAPER